VAWTLYTNGALLRQLSESDGAIAFAVDALIFGCGSVPNARGDQIPLLVGSERRFFDAGGRAVHGTRVGRGGGEKPASKLVGDARIDSPIDDTPARVLEGEPVPGSERDGSVIHRTRLLWIGRLEEHRPTSKV